MSLFKTILRQIKPCKKCGLDPITSIIGGGVSGAANIASTALTNQTNLEIADKYNQTQRDLQQEQNEFNERMWNLNNEYNSLSSQKKRAEEAGINVNSMLGNSATSTPVQQTTLPNQQMPQLAAPQFDLSAATKAFADAQKSISEKNLADNEAIYQDIYNRKADALLSSMTEEKRASAKLMLAQIPEIAQKIQNYQVEAKRILQETKFLKLRGREQQIINEFKSEQFTAELNKIAADTKVSEQQVKYLANKILCDIIGAKNDIIRTHAQAELQKQQAELTFQENKNARILQATLYNESSMSKKQLEILNETGPDLAREQVSKAQWENSPLIRTLDAAQRTLELGLTWKNLITKPQKRKYKTKQVTTGTKEDGLITTRYSYE